MKFNCVVSLTTISGNADNKSQGTAVTEVRCFLSPANNDALVLYPELPIGQTFSFVFCSDEITLKPETQIKVTDPFSSELAENDVFIIDGIPTRVKIGGQFYYSGVCVRKDS